MPQSALGQGLACGQSGELRRRNVLRAGALYVAAVWALAAHCATWPGFLDALDWGTCWFVVAAIIGFPFWLAFAWFYEFTPEGLKRESEIDPSESITAHTGKKLDRWIFAVMGIAIVLLLLTNTFVWHKGAGLRDADSALIPEHSIAVLPFVDMSSGRRSGILLRWHLGGTFEPAGKDPAIAGHGAHVIVFIQGQGDRDSGDRTHLARCERARRLVRKAGDSVRITAQLIDASTDTHLWSQTYDRKLDDIFLRSRTRLRPMWSSSSR